MAEEIPGYRDAISRERLRWAIAFLPVNERICGVEVTPFTPLHHLSLDVAESPFLCGGAANRVHAVQFLWAISPLYSPESRWRRFWFARGLRNKNLVDLILGIEEYIDETFTDCDGIKERQKVCYNFTVSLLHALCPKYGGRDEVMRMPYKQIFQLLKPIQRDRGVPIGASSDALKSAWRANQNESALAALKARASGN